MNLLSRNRVPLTAALLLALTSSVWGISWPVMKIVIGEMPVLTFRVVIAWGSGIVILAIAALSGSEFRLHRRDIGPAMLAAALSISGWFYLSTLALTMMPAGRASVLAYTMPLWAFLAAIWLTGERVTVNRVLGLGFGLATVLVLTVEEFARFGRVPLGVIVTLTAAASWGLGTVIQKKITWHTRFSRWPAGNCCWVAFHWPDSPSPSTAPRSTVSPSGALPELPMSLYSVPLLAIGRGSGQSAWSPAVPRRWASCPPR